MTVCREVLQ
jgi:hypothetical protein